MREQGNRTKFNPLAEVAGKRVVVVDDSIVRGSSTRQIVAMLFDAGASEVHVRISSPPVVSPCFYGIDLASEDEMIAAHARVNDIRAAIERRASPTSRLTASRRRPTVPADALCRACLTREYPTRVPTATGKLRFEPSSRSQRRAPPRPWCRAARLRPGRPIGDPRVAGRRADRPSVHRVPRPPPAGSPSRSNRRVPRLRPRRRLPARRRPRMRRDVRPSRGDRRSASDTRTPSPMSNESRNQGKAASSSPAFSCTRPIFASETASPALSLTARCSSIARLVYPAAPSASPRRVAMAPRFASATAQPITFSSRSNRSAHSR